MNSYGYGDGCNNGGGMGPGDQSNRRGDANTMMMAGHETLDDNFSQGQSLDEIVSQNSQAIRKQSWPQQSYGQSAEEMNTGMGQISMMEFGAGSPASQMANFQFSPSRGLEQGNIMPAGVAAGLRGQQQQQQQQQHHGIQERRQSHPNLAVNTAFANASHGYHPMTYTSPAHPRSGFDLAMRSSYNPNGVPMQMNYNIDSSMGNESGGDLSQMQPFPQSRFQQTMMNAPVSAPGLVTSWPSHGQPYDPGGGANMANLYSNQLNRDGNALQPQQRQAQPGNMQLPDGSSQFPTNVTSPLNQGPSSIQQGHSSAGFAAQPQHPQPGSREDRGMGRQIPNSTVMYDGINGPVPVNIANYNPNIRGFDWQPEEGGWPSTMIGRPHMQTAYKNAYSSSGFDMLGVVMRVATRPNPEIDIGSVDLSCAFVVCDAEKDDFPIVYCSDNFERLTGYTKHMILGRNCRFLQSPDGNVAPGMKRKYVDDNSVLYLKNMITLRREAQISLINYRRGGQPFMNLLTMIPITWDTEQVKFFVGFQVDLVEAPSAMTNKNADGSYAINYRRGMGMPRYIQHVPDSSQKGDLGQTVSNDEVSAMLSTVHNGESEYVRRMWDKMLLENTDDVVHVLSLKGLFQWISPSALEILEYEPSEIIGTALSSICHPSDIVPVTRELKDASNGAAVNIVFRIRRKNSGYMWFEGNGSLHTEQGKGRKSIILVGRERPVYALSKSDIASAGGVGENELWSKMSTSGMFLFVSSNVRQLLDKQAEELVGTSIQALMRKESYADFGRILEHARTGKRASAKHEIINKRGQVLAAHTTLYPGDATEGQKPTFIVAQTRLTKYSQSAPANRPYFHANQVQSSPESIQTGFESKRRSSGGQSHTGTDEGARTSSTTSARYRITDGSAATYAGEHGLVIGRQDASLASEDNLFDELKATKSSSWQYEIHQLEKRNRALAEEVQALISAKKKRKRRRGKDPQKNCANCHTKTTPEWRRGPSGNRDLCNSCGLRWAKVNGRVSPRTSSAHSPSNLSETKLSKRASGSASASPRHSVSGSVGVGIKQEQQSPRSSTMLASPPMVSGTFSESPKSMGAKSGESTAGLGAMHSASMEGGKGVPDKIEEGVEEPD